MEGSPPPPLPERQETPPAGQRFRAAWLGVVLSLFVSGFGLVRARQFGRGVLWFVVGQLTGLATICLFITRAVPAAVVIAACVICFVMWLYMLRDNCRPGRMTLPLWILFAVALLAAGLVPPLPKIVAQAFMVPTSAMEPTLCGIEAGGPDHVIVNRTAYWFSEPKRGDIAVFETRGITALESEARYVEGTVYVKRLVDLPGETIEIHDGHVFANGRQLGTRDGLPAVTYEPPRFPQYPASYKVQVPEKSYFMLGDNSPRSSDSRYWGFVPQENLIGRVSRIYWPVSRISVPQ